MGTVTQEVNYAQGYLKGLELAVLTEQEYNFLNELAHGVDDNGQPINGTEAARRTFGCKTDKACRTRAYKVLNGGASTSDDSKLTDKQLQKKAAVNLYLGALFENKREDTRLTEQEIIGKVRRVFDISVGDERVNLTLNHKGEACNQTGYATNPASAKAAAELLAKMGGFLVQKVEVANPFDDLTDDELEALEKDLDKPDD